MDQPGQVPVAAAPPGPQGLLQCIEDQGGLHRGGGAPAQDPPRVRIDDERDVDHPGPGAHVGARQPPRPGTAIVTGKGLAGQGTEDFFASPGLGLTLIRPARKNEKPRPFPNWLRQRVEAIIWTLKNQLGLERHGAHVPAGLWARFIQRLLALNAAIWFNWQSGVPVKRSLIAFDY